MPGKGPLRRSEWACPRVSPWTRRGQRRCPRRTLLPPPPAPTQGTRPALGHLRARAFRHMLASKLGQRPSPPLGPRGTICWSGGPTVAGTKISVPSEWMGDKVFCTCPGTVRSRGASSTRHLDPRTTSGDQTVRPGGRAGGTDADGPSSPGATFPGSGDRRTRSPSCRPCPQGPRHVLSEPRRTPWGHHLRGEPSHRCPTPWSPHV